MFSHLLRTHSAGGVDLGASNVAVHINGTRKNDSAGNIVFDDGGIFFVCRFYDLAVSDPDIRLNTVDAICRVINRAAGEMKVTQVVTP